MARKRRIQYAGAIYHVINRGNYRRDLFGTADKAKATTRRAGGDIAAGVRQLRVTRPNRSDAFAEGGGEGLLFLPAEGAL